MTTLTTERPRSGDSHVDLPRGRRLAYTTYGALEGPLVVVLDGPCSRGLARAAGPAAAELGIRLVAPDRPGCGRSSAAAGRGIADWPADHAALLDALGAERAGILSQSGGTPYAIAAAAGLGERTIALAGLGPVAPFDDPDSVRELGGELRAGSSSTRCGPCTSRRPPRSSASRRRSRRRSGCWRSRGASIPPALACRRAFGAARTTPATRRPRRAGSRR